MATNQNRFSHVIRENEAKTVDVVESILIVCEGTKTEPNYFEAFSLYNLAVKIVGRGSNTMDLVHYAIKEKESYDSVWCVFDKDDFPAENFNRACVLAEKNGIELAYSVESFELWFLLHFEYLNTGINRKQYIQKLNQLFQLHFDKEYEKNSDEVYDLLYLDRQQTAITNAKRLVAEYSESTLPASRYPVTYVYRLVEKLNQFLKEKRWQVDVDEELVAYRKNAISTIKSVNVNEKMLSEYIDKINYAKSNDEVETIIIDYFSKL